MLARRIPTVVFEDVKEGFAFFYHPEFIACTLFDRFVALLEITHFGVEYAVSGLELPIGFFLGGKIAFHLPDLEPSAFAQP